MAINIPNRLFTDPEVQNYIKDLWKTVASDLVNTPTEDEKAALTGTTSPSAATPYVNDDDTRIPSAGQKAALAGTAGTPSSTNKYVTDSDTRLSIVIVSIGELTLDNGGGTTTTVADTKVTATCRIKITPTNGNSAVAGVFVSTKNAGVSFVVTHPATPGAGATMDYQIADNA